MDEIEIKENQSESDESDGTQEKKRGKIARFLLKKLSKKTKIILVVLLIVLGGLFAYGIYKMSFDTGGTAKVEKQEEKQTGVECPMDGEYVKEELTKRRPIGVMIENNVAARPQSGLNKADLVYEVVTEGGITRFLAFYQCGDADEIGPVRSTRIYYLDWVQELKSFYAHAGGSPDALASIAQKGILDINHMQQYFWRSSSRYAPHNLYTSTEDLRKAAEYKKYNLDADSFDTWKFKDDAEASKRPASQSVKINFSSYTYMIEYVYNKKTNDYTRKVAGAVDKDSKTGKEIKVKNVVVQFTQITHRLNEEKNRVDVGTIGSGSALFFVDGKASDGTWNKKSATNRTEYKDENGQEIEFSRGPIWVAVVQTGSSITY